MSARKGIIFSLWLLIMKATWFDFVCYIEQSHTISHIWNSLWHGFVREVECAIMRLVCFVFSSVIPTSLLYENINSKAYFTLTNIGKGRIPIGGAVSAFVPPLSQRITSSKSWSLTKKGYQFQLCLELLPSLFIFEERICERSWILSISDSSSHARPLLPIGLVFLCALRELWVRSLGASHPEGLLIRGFFVASPVLSIDRKKENLIVDTFLASFSRPVCLKRWFGHNYWNLTLR